MVVPIAINIAMKIAGSRPKNRHVVMAPAAMGIPYDIDEADIEKGVEWATDSAKDADIFETKKKVKSMLAKKSRFLVLSR